jgi:hypothetical protein
MPAGTIAFYDFGNQISGSRVVIADDGSITHEERTCCPPATTPVSETALTANELADLQADVQSVAAGSWTTTEGPPPALGANGGQLCVISGGSAFTVRVIEGTTANTLEHESTAAGAADIETLVFGYAEKDMP